MMIMHLRSWDRGCFCVSAMLNPRERMTDFIDLTPRMIIIDMEANIKTGDYYGRIFDF